MSPDIEERLSQVDDLPRALEAIKVLVECVKFLEKENAQLKEKIARLEKNSSTSSKPPSSDIVKPPQAQRQRGVRKCGGQAGHKGSCRSKLKPDIIEPVHLESCPRCGCSELGKEDPKNVKFHQQAELVVKPVKVTQYNLHGRYCACCKRVRYPSLPAGVIQGHVFGPRLLSLCGYIKATIGASVSNITELFVDVFELPVSRGTIQNAIFRVSDSLQEPYDEALESLRKEKSLNVDETGWKENGKRFWVWLFCTPLIACFVIRPSRGSLVLKEILGEVFGGAITSDFYSAYVCYATAIQQFCLAHFIRDLKFLTTLSQDVSRIFGEKLLDYMKLIFALWHKRQDLTPEQFQNGNRSVAWHQRGRASVEEMRGDSLLHESPCAALLFST